ncbi:efflux RND transporter periplasmic adaptor subunit [Maribacter sp. 2307ULW6-5]|uniref:efflux RND transporter periplasmic adaptor subunit n=1 Tax=Maribacter sp. 2307ULW6-5 TaxID=3386275 RepID=UPI0039BD38B3
MKKNVLFMAGALLVGLLGGYLIFGTGDKGSGLNGHDHGAQATNTAQYTCSMHPQIMQPDAGDCPICGMDLIPAAENADGLAVSQFKLTENAMALANIATTVLGEGETSGNNLILSGTIEENQEAVAVQAAYFSGRLEKRFVNYEGEEVRKGQQLATIYSPELVAAQQELISASGLKEAQPALYHAVRKKLELWKLTDAQILAIERSQTVKEYFPIYANVSGTVSEILVDRGDYVAQGAPMFKVANLSTVWAVFDAYENQVSGIRGGQPMEIGVNALPDVTLPAKVSFVNPVMDPVGRTVEVRAVLDNANGRLKPGMFVTGVLQERAQTENELLVVPESAVLWTGERSVVYLKPDPEHPIFELREVQLGGVVGNGYRVLSGLRPGDEVVTQGTFNVDAAAQLMGKPSMMAKGNGDGETAAPVNLQYPEAHQKKLWGSLPAYMALKEALVLGDPVAARAAAQKMGPFLENMETKALEGPEKASLEQGLEMLKAMAGNEELERQRAHFVRFNEALIPMLKAVDGMPAPVYVQTCPMANNNSGANWLSMEQAIANPYYGSAMLACGSVMDTLGTLK